MNFTSEPSDNLHTKKVKELINLVYVKTRNEQTLYGDARHYFSVTQPQLAKHTALQEQLAKLANDKHNDNNKARKESLEFELKALKSRIDKDHTQRVIFAHDVVQRVLDLCNADSFEQSQHKCARVLGTLMLSIQGNRRSQAHQHQRLKPIYRAVLTIALLDKLLHEGLLDLSLLEDQTSVQLDWKHQLITPIIMGSLLLDCGMQHPEARKILEGSTARLDPFRKLSTEERKQILTYNFQYLFIYLENGLNAFVANDKVTQYVKHLLLDSFKTTNSFGDLIKIPQIYSSIILSTKSNYDKRELPKAYSLIQQLSESGKLSPTIASAFNQMVGYFPQGFGITYISNIDVKDEPEHLEYAIVTRFNPRDPIEPACRIVSRAGKYTAKTSENTIDRGANMFFKSNHRKLRKIAKGRLMEIIAGLKSGYNSEDEEQYFPSHWEPNDYFSAKRNQNLWHNKEN